MREMLQNLQIAEVLSVLSGCYQKALTKKALLVVVIVQLGVRTILLSDADFK